MRQLLVIVLPPGLCLTAPRENFPPSETIVLSGTLTVNITGFRNNQGQASIALFNRADAFPKSLDKAVKVVYSPIKNNKASATFENLAAGGYAVSVFHDENNNGKMDSNLFGIPKEGVGASNDAKGHFGPPKYKDAEFTFNGTTETISIKLVYL
jgi:uncharacterized protein (DUF2141 family)